MHTSSLVNINYLRANPGGRSITNVRTLQNTGVMKVPRVLVLLCTLVLALVYVMEVRRIGQRKADNRNNVYIYQDTAVYSNVSHGAVKAMLPRAKVSQKVAPFGFSLEKLKLAVASDEVDKAVSDQKVPALEKMTTVATRDPYNDVARKKVSVGVLHENVTDAVSIKSPVGSGGIITWSPGSRWTKLTERCTVGKDFALSHLQSHIDTPIFVYKEEVDEVVSGSILKTGIWEKELVEKLQTFLRRDPDLVLLDIGANVGVFSLMAAKLGRTVFSIDCLTGNVHRLCASVSAGNLSKQVTIIHNAMSNTRENVTFGGYRGNVGATYVKKLDNSSIGGKDVVMSILLDDLLELYKFKKVMIKIDVEAFEANVFRGGETFFSKVQVHYLLMEFKYHRGRKSGQYVVDFLYRHNIVPMLEAGIDRKPSSLKGTIPWPEDVLWVRKELESKAV
ncbi:uncharacterized protein [Argopecten irradians]|uniref:uncharacterized protein n=1 Tax=Argopecten irradians TaxID=31199 RepID=UPI0037240CBB